MERHRRELNFRQLAAQNVILSDIPASGHAGPPFARLGRHEVLEQVGLSSWVTRYRVRDSLLDRPACVRIFRSSANKGLLERFATAARSASRLTHRHIEGLYDIAERDDLQVVSEDLPYPTLDQMLTGSSELHLSDNRAATGLREPWPVSRALKLIVPLTQALGYAHQRGVVHRQVDPRHVYIDERGEPKLAEFGVGWVLLTETPQCPEQMRASAAYFSPEAIRRDAELDERSDIYSLGAVLYELLSGRPPFDTANLGLLLQSHITERPRALPRETSRTP